MRKLFYIPAAFLLVLLVGLSGCFFSVPTEFEQGSIAGIAQDQYLKGIPQVQVTLVGTENVAYTDDTGTFFFGELEPGSYTLSFYKEGFPTQQKNVTVQKGQSRTIMVEMLPQGAQSGNGGIMSGIDTTSVSNLQGQNNVNTATNPTAGVYMLYVANAGPLPQNNPYSPENMAQGNNPWGTGNDPSINPPSTAGGGIQSEIAMMYGADPVSEAYAAANQGMGPNATQQEMQTFAQYSGKKKNNLLIVNSVTRGAVSIIEWNPNVRPFWLDMSDNGMLYIADSSNNITVLNTNANNAVMTTIALGSYIVCDIALGMSGSRLYCALGSGGDPVVGVIDTTSNSFLQTIPLPRLKDGSIGQPWGICTHKNGQRAYVALGTATGGEVVFINTLSNSVQGTVTVGQNPFGLDVTPDGKKLYVANQNSANVSVVDTTTSQVTGTVGVGFSPTRVAITPDGSRAFVTNKGSNSVTVIDTMTNSAITTLPVGQEPVGIAISRDGKTAYVTNTKSDDVSMIDVMSNAVINKTIPFPGGMPFDVIVK